MKLPDFAGLDAKNVYIYVADAVRWDSLPKDVRGLGPVVKTVSASIHSPASFASIVTGRYPPTHGVTNFGSRVPQRLPTLLYCEDYHTDFLNTLGSGDGNDPIYKVLDQPPDDRSEPLNGVSEPFIFIERAQGGHAPYGSHSGTAAEYFENHRDTPIDTIRTAYYEGVKSDAQRFSRRLESLSQRDLLCDTLVIYTADHGELLGEGGMFGHNGPIRPELVYVPTVFVHPELPDREIEATFGHTDLFPTVATVLDIFDDFAGEHQDERTNRRYSFYEDSFKLPVLGSQKMQYNSVWNADGGRVLTDTPEWVRVVGAFDDLFDSQQRFLARRKSFIFNLIDSYRTQYHKFGSPRFDFNPKTDIEDFFALKNIVATESFELSDAARDRLRELGYL